jgi:hypothetical protein
VSQLSADVVLYEFARRYVESKPSRRSALKFEPEPEIDDVEKVNAPVDESYAIGVDAENRPRM